MSDAITSDSIIEVTHLTKTFRRADRTPGLAGAIGHLVRPRYRDLTAVRDISFAVEPGESLAYVGPNGAGKSTTIKLLTGILVPTSGSVSVCGLEPFRDRTTNARNISVVFGQRTQLWWDIAVRESFQLLRRIYEVEEADYRRTLAELDEVLELDDLMGVPARQLSLGQRMRCDLAAALLHRPRVLFLDEPTIGLDVSVKARFRELIKKLRDEQGLTIMLTSHDLGDIEELCERMMMIDRGVIIYDGSLPELQQRFGWERQLLITVDAARIDRDAVAGSLAEFAVRVEDREAASVAVHFDSRTIGSAELIRALPSALPISDIAVVETSIESIVRRLYEGDLGFDETQPSG